VEVEATYFWALFKGSANRLSGTEFQCPSSRVVRTGSLFGPKMCAPIACIPTSSENGMPHPPCSNLLRTSSSGRPGPCITPSNVTLLRTTTRLNGQLPMSVLTLADPSALSGNQLGKRGCLESWSGPVRAQNRARLPQGFGAAPRAARSIRWLLARRGDGDANPFFASRPRPAGTGREPRKVTIGEGEEVAGACLIGALLARLSRRLVPDRVAEA
jgi:hypothetical protein